MATRKLTVTAQWDEEAQVWVATSEDLPGLILETASMDELIPELETIIPQLLELEGDELTRTAGTLELNVVSHIQRSLTIQASAA